MCETATWLPPDRRFAISEMRKAGLSAVQLGRQVTRHFHAGLRLLNRRLVPLTHIGFSFREFKTKQWSGRSLESFANPNSTDRPTLPLEYAIVS